MAAACPQWAAAAMLGCGKAVPVATVDFDLLRQMIRPDVIVDARLRKRSIPESQIGQATLTIGLGPNFIAGETIDVAIETSWGDQLGQVITQGPTRELAGEPRALDGVGRERFIYASRAGLFNTEHHIGEMIEQGAAVATLDGEPLFAPLAGCIRGLTRDGVPVDKGTKVVEIDPRGQREAVFGLGERPKRIAVGVLRALDMGVAFTPHMFRFESSFEAALQCMPMKARFNLDACGIKVPSEHWRAMPIAVRRRLLEMGTETSKQIALCRDYVLETLARHALAPLQPIPTAAQTWADTTAVASSVVEKAISIGVNPPTIEQWAHLTNLQRFALIKLTRPGHANRNFLPALREFGIA